MASKHAVQNLDEEMTGCEMVGDKQHVRRRPVRYAKLAAANQENVANSSKKASVAATGCVMEIRRRVDLLHD